MPKVKVAQSHAYGAAGRIAAAGDLGVPAPTSFAAAFESQREGAILRDEAVSDLSRLSVGSARISVGSQHSAGQQSEYDDDDDNLFSPDVSKSFGNDREAAIAVSSNLPADTNAGFKETNGHVPSPSVRPESEVPDLQVEPERATARWSWEAFTKNFPKMPMYGMQFAAFCLGLVFVSWLLSARLSSPFKAGNDIHAGNGNLDRRVEGLERTAKDIKGTLARFSDNLPSLVTAKKHPDGTLEIGDDFWQALLSKMRAVGLGQPSHDQEKQWQEFLENNKEMVSKTLAQNAKIDSMKKVDDRIAVALQTRQVLQREEFIELMQNEYGKLAGQINKQIEDATTKLEKEQRAYLRNAAKEVVAKTVIDQIRLESLAYTNIVANTELALKTVNHFSPMLGARVDPWLTSPTWSRRISTLSKIINFVYSGSYLRQAPITALEKWDEAAECWCAAPSTDKGLAQLAVQMPQKIAPTRITIEHIPKEGTLNPGSTPKDMEFWIQIEDRGKYELVKEILDNRKNTPKCKSTSLSKTQGYVCLGQFSYNLHGNNHVQTFDLDVDLGPLNIGAKNAVLRVNENWGSDWTCLYRVRLQGTVVEGDDFNM